MPMLDLSDEQTIDLVKQLSPEQQATVFKFLLAQRWPTWADLSNGAEDRIRQAVKE